MKKAIFLVDDIVDGKVVTLLERVYEKLIAKLVTEGYYQFGWISETPRTLYNCSSDFITFRKASEFIKEVTHIGSMNDNVDVFYFISTWLHVKTFHLTDFFSMDPDITDFLIKHNIPILIDGSTEMDNMYLSSFNLFETDYVNYLTAKNHYFRGIKNLKFFIMGGELVADYTKTNKRNVIVQHSMFPGAFFHKVYINSNIYSTAVAQKEVIFDSIKNKVITADTPIWQAFCKTPRLTRTLFQLWADKEKLTDYGQYSRLLPAKDDFIQEIRNTGIAYKYQTKLNFITDHMLNNLDTIKYIDQSAKNHLQEDVTGIPVISTAMFQIVLETSSIIGGDHFDHTPSMLTEKTSMTILAGMPFITLGGHQIKNILKSLGFREYPGLELPGVGESNYFDELEYVIAKVKEIANLPLEEKQKLYDSWKEIIMYNYNRYLNLDTKKLYLECLHQAR